MLIIKLKLFKTFTLILSYFGWMLAGFFIWLVTYYFCLRHSSVSLTWVITATSSVYNPSVYLEVKDSQLQSSLACYNDAVTIYDGKQRNSSWAEGGGAAVAKSHSNICVNMQDRQIEISLQHHNHL